MATDLVPTVKGEATEGVVAGQLSPEKTVSPRLPSVRLLSLDAFRGFTMFWIAGGTSLMLGLQNLGHNAVLDTIVDQLQHTDWQGLRFYDLIWPCFMLMTGMSLPFSYAYRGRYGRLRPAIRSRGGP